EDGADVRVVQQRRGAGLAEEAGAQGGPIAAVQPGHLEGHQPIELGIAGQEDGAHAAAAEPADDLITPEGVGQGKGLIPGRGGVGRGGGRRGVAGGQLRGGRGAVALDRAVLGAYRGSHAGPRPPGASVLEKSSGYRSDRTGGSGAAIAPGQAVPYRGG